jgi:hypothetical protein
MLVLEDCPYDVVYLICEEACSLDAGLTARALSLTSRYISAVAYPFLYHSVAVRGIAQAQRAHAHLSNLPPVQRAVRHLLIADLPADYMCIEPTNTDTPTSSAQRSNPALQLRGKWGTERALKFQRALDALLSLLSPSLRTLAVLTHNPWQRFALANLGGTPFPALKSLLLSQHTRMHFRAGTHPVAPFVMPRLRRAHLSLTGTGYIDFRVEGAVRLFARGCPALAQLRLSDVDFYFGGKDALVRLLGDIHAARTGLADPGALSVPPNVASVVLQPAKSVGPGLAREEMHALRALRDGLAFGGLLALDTPRLLRSFDEWLEEWLEASCRESCSPKSTLTRARSRAVARTRGSTPSGATAVRDPSAYGHSTRC